MIWCAEISLCFQCSRGCNVFWVLKEVSQALNAQEISLLSECSKSFQNFWLIKVIATKNRSSLYNSNRRSSKTVLTEKINIKKDKFCVSFSHLNYHVFTQCPFTRSIFFLLFLSRLKDFTAMCIQWRNINKR